MGKKYRRPPLKEIFTHPLQRAAENPRLESILNQVRDGGVMTREEILEQVEKSYPSGRERK
jgi:hypothetical protein